MTEKTDKTSLLTFPCDFTVKVFGQDAPEFNDAVLAIMSKHVPDFVSDSIQTRPSENGKYIALSIHIRATSKEQLDSIYRDLTACPLVIMAL